MHIAASKTNVPATVWGIAFCVKEKLAKFVKRIDSSSDYIMWVQLDKRLMNVDENVMLGVSYIPPAQSKYFNDEEILNLEREITSVCSSYKYVLISGDLSARTAKLKDNTLVDSFNFDTFDFDAETRAFFDKTPILEKYTVSHFSYAPLIKCKITQKRNVLFLF